VTGGCPPAAGDGLWIFQWL